MLLQTSYSRVIIVLSAYGDIRALLALLLVFLSSPVYASEQVVTQWQRQLAQLAPDASERISPLLALANYYLFSDPQKAALYSKMALPLVQSLEDDFLHSQTLRILGQALMYEGANSDAFKHLNQAIVIAKRTKSAHLISVTTRVMGVFYELILDYDNALSYYIEALRYASQSDYPQDKAAVFNNLGNVFNAQGDYQEAMNYLSQAININRKLKDIDMQMNASVSLAVAYMKLGELSKAYQMLISIVKREEQISDFTYSEALVNLAHIARLQNQFAEAIAYYRKVISEKRAGSYPQALAAAYHGLACALDKIGNTAQAAKIYRQGIAAVKDKTSVESEMNLYEGLAKLELRQGNYQAAALVQASYIERRNQVQPFTNESLVKKLQSQLALERDNTRLQQELWQSERSARNASRYLFGIVAVSLLSLVLLLFLLLRRRSINQLTALNQRLKNAAETDPLTKVGNRRFLDTCLKLHKNSRRPVAFMLLDIDQFKSINDHYGHDRGDEVLVSVAAKVKSFCRKDDAIARIGGEEFVILLMNIDNDSALKLANRIRQAIGDLTHSIQRRVTVSIGVSFGNLHDQSFDVLYKKADTALYQAKQGGRNQVRVYTTN